MSNDKKEQIALLPWLDPVDSSKAFLNLTIDNKEDYRGRFKRNIWGGVSSGGIFEWEQLNAIVCIYLPPLRDAEEKLRAFRGSRLARLLKNMCGDLPEGEVHPLEMAFNAANHVLLKNPTIQEANKAIKKYSRESTGELFGQDSHIQFAEASFERIVERLQLLFYPKLPKFRTENNAALFRALEENSLGYNNLLYLATVLAELEGLKDDQTLHKLLLIEEPEAHLHPQLQNILLNYLERISKDDKIQIVVSTHSPTLAASVSLKSIKVLTKPDVFTAPQCTSLDSCGISEDSMFFLDRWLDVTKSTLLFAKAVILVEGIAEALVLPEIAKKVINDYNTANPDNKIPATLSLNGVSIINMGGIYFKHFMQLFKGYFNSDEDTIICCDSLNIRCAGITDCDPNKEDYPLPDGPCSCKNSAVTLCDELKTNSANCRLFTNLKTFEYDLALEENNIKIMAEAYCNSIETAGDNRKIAEEYQTIDWNTKTIIEKSDAAKWLLIHISDTSVTKGLFAQNLAMLLQKQPDKILSVPEYIRDAVLWAVGL